MSLQFDADIALLTERRFAAKVADPNDWYFKNILRDDELLSAALLKLGLSAVRVDWLNKDVDWSKFRCAVFRTTWDYFVRFDEFKDWLDRINLQTRLCNEYSIVKWNMDKHYLADLQKAGIPIVESRFIERGHEFDLSELLEKTGWDEAVVKPSVSGAARHTYRVNRCIAHQLQSVLQTLVTRESFLIQPFMQDVLDRGEDTLMVFNGRFSHAIRKRPKAGDFRVQNDFGGTDQDIEPTDEQIALAERAAAQCQPAPAYARVDMVRDNQDRLAIMELELIEPELWLRNHPPAATRFAEAIAAVLNH